MPPIEILTNGLRFVLSACVDNYYKLLLLLFTQQITVQTKVTVTDTVIRQEAAFVNYKYSKC